jgi:hypothetical protein
MNRLPDALADTARDMLAQCANNGNDKNTSSLSPKIAEQGGNIKDKGKYTAVTFDVQPQGLVAKNISAQLIVVKLNHEINLCCSFSRFCKTFKRVYISNRRKVVSSFGNVAKFYFTAR